MRRPILIAAFALIATASPAAAREGERKITPYIEATQVLSADITNDDVLTYTSLAAGVDANVQSRRVQIGVSYRYEHRFAYDSRLADNDVHSGLARASVRVAQPLTIEAGALASRIRADIRGAAPGVLTGNDANVSQLFSFYGGPTVGTHVGVLGVSGGYRYGYTKVEAPGVASPVSGQRIDLFDESRSQLAQASLNLRQGTVLPFGLTLSGAWERDDASQLDQRYEGRFGRLDALQPVSRTLALTAGVGYENIRITQRDALVDANGVPVIDAGGRFQTDPASPRRLAYDFDGLYYDAGVVWRPNARAALEFHAGERYGDFSAIGSFTYQASKRVAVRVSGYDGIQTFGRQVQGALSAIGTDFRTGTTALGNDFNGCVFGARGGAAGNCLNGALQSATAAAYRARGVDAVVGFTGARTSYGIGAGYADRRFLTPDLAPGLVANGAEDQSYYLQAYFSRALDRRTNFDANVFANYYKSGVGTRAGVYNIGGTASLVRRLGHVSVYGTAGVYNFGVDGSQSVTSVELLLGGRYSF